METVNTAPTKDPTHQALLCLRYLPPTLRKRRGIFSTLDSGAPPCLLIRLIEVWLAKFMADCGEAALQRGEDYLRVALPDGQLVLVITGELIWRMHIRDGGRRTEASLSLNCAAAGSGEFFLVQTEITAGAPEITLEVLCEPGNTTYHKLMKLNGSDRIVGIMQQLLSDDFYRPGNGAGAPDYSFPVQQWMEVQHIFIDSIASVGLIPRHGATQPDLRDRGLP